MEKWIKKSIHSNTTKSQLCEDTVLNRSQTAIFEREIRSTDTVFGEHLFANDNFPFH